LAYHDTMGKGVYRILRKLLLAALCTLPPAEMLAIELSDKDAEEIEQLLTTLKFDPGTVDGVVDARTRSAIRLYQEFAALPVDGEPSAALLRELRQVVQVLLETKSEEAKTGPSPAAATEAAAPVMPPDPQTSPVSQPAAPVASAEPEAVVEPEPEPKVPVVSELPVPEQAAVVPATIPGPQPNSELAPEADGAAAGATVASTASAVPSEPGAATTQVLPLNPRSEPQSRPQRRAQPPGKSGTSSDFDDMIARLVRKNGNAAATTADRPSPDLALAVQRQLARIGLDPGALDGRLGAQTAQAIKTYQNARNISVDGRPTRGLLDQLARERSGQIFSGGTVQISVLERIRGEATRHEEDERWKQALQAYERALRIDENTSFAIRGKTRVAKRVKLNQQVEYYLTNPNRLQSPDPMAHAREVLKVANAISDVGASLRDKRDRLQKLIDGFSTPRSVIFRSDEKTDVTVFQVSRLGQFSERRMMLRPGVYTALGSRAGYRDVRIRFRVPPSDEKTAIIIRCEEKI
jgi:peptidoglycan hydrolase-like protein with peptidoglycan-binding domain